MAQTRCSKNREMSHGRDLDDITGHFFILQKANLPRFKCTDLLAVPLSMFVQTREAAAVLELFSYSLSGEKGELGPYFTTIS